MSAYTNLLTVRNVADLRSQIAAWRVAGDSVALVPTMGALHDGHMALISRGHEMASKVCATLFVNPTQFGENEDLDSYPRPEKQDKAKLSDAGVDLLYAPTASEMYGEGDATRITVDGLGDRLEGAYRPGFFTGVATVVTKLLLQALPDVALFGEKDFQQLQVIKRLVQDLNIPVTIEGVPCVREANGLALSSRNAYLSDEERAIAPSLNKVMVEMVENMRAGMEGQKCSEMAKAALLQAGFTSVDYLVACDATDLIEISTYDDLGGKLGRLMGAAWLRNTRLIDNLSL